MERGTQPRKVFLSYRSSDRAVVGEFAERLRRDGLDAWFDHWEVAPGDDIVARMDEGVDGCTAGLIFVSQAWFDGPWARDEYTSLVLRRVEDGIRLIPVLIEEVGNRLPARLRKLARRSVSDYKAIRDTLLGIDHRPGVATALEARTHAVTVQLQETAGDATVSLLVDGQDTAQETGVRVPGSLGLGHRGPANPTAPTTNATCPSPTTNWPTCTTRWDKANRPAPSTNNPSTSPLASPRPNPTAPTTNATCPSPISGSGSASPSSVALRKRRAL